MAWLYLNWTNITLNAESLTLLPPVLVPLKDILNLLNADDLYLYLRHGAMEQAVDTLVGFGTEWHLHQAEALVWAQSPHRRVPGAELLQRVHTEVWRNLSKSPGA